MSAPLTAQEIAVRLMNYPHDRYIYIGGFMRSVIWAAGTYVLIELLSNPRKYWPRLIPWVASLFATMVTLMTWGRGVLLTNSMANLADSFLPTLMGIAEFCLFALLAPRRDGETGSDSESGNFGLWNYWFFVLAIHTGLAALLVTNRIANTNIARDFEPRLQSLGTEYMQWMYLDRAGASFGFGIFLAFGVVTMLLVRKAKQIQKDTADKTDKEKEVAAKKIRRYIIVTALLAIFPILIYWKVVNDAEAQRQRTDEIVSSFKTAPPAQEVK